MRVAMIDPSLFTLPYDQALAGALVGQGHQVVLHGRRPGPDDPDPLPGTPPENDFYRLAGSRAVSAMPRAVRLGVKGADHLWSMLRLLRRLRRERPDVIHFQWLPLPAVDGPLLAAFRRVAPLVLTVHDTNPFNGDPSAKLQASGMTRTFAAFGRLILHTRQGALRLVAQGVDARRVAVVAHGPLPVHGTIREREEDPMHDPPSFVLFGKLKPYKGADVLVDAFGRLPPPLRARARVRIVGKPYMDLAPLHAQVAQLGLGDQVTIEPRFVSDSEIPDVFGPGSVAVFPYREIEASGVLSQALSLGRPVIASRLGNMAETLVDGAHGHLVPPDDPAALSAAMAHMIGDQGFRAACSRNATALCDAAVGWDEIAAQTAELYAEARAQPVNPVRATRRT